MKKLSSIVVMFVLLLTASRVPAREAPHELQKDFNVSDGGSLVVRVDGSDILVRVWNKSQVQMNVENIGDDADRVKAEQNGNTVTVEYRSRGGLWSSSSDVKFDFYVPSKFNLELTTSGGDISTSGAISGAVSLTTSGGDLHVDDVNGKVEGQTSGGDVTVNHVSSDSRFSSSGGDIKVEQAGANLELSTSGGDIKTGTVGGNLKAYTAGGDVNVGRVGGELHVSTSSGDVTVGNVGKSAAISTSGGDISMRSGGGNVDANTSGGDIDIQRAVGSVHAISSGGTVKAGLTPKGSGTSRLTSTGGDVYLYLPADARATIEAEVFGAASDNSIESDFPMTLQGDIGNFGNRKAEIVINGGGQKIDLRTTSGSIYVKKMGSHEN